MINTKVISFRSKREMDRGVKVYQKKGWTVSSVQAVQSGYGCLKTLILGFLFFPLALLGRKPATFLVTFQRVGG